MAIPGEVAGLAYAHQKYGSGTLTWADLLAPAIKFASEGMELVDATASLLQVPNAFDSLALPWLSFASQSSDLHILIYFIARQGPGPVEPWPG